MSWPWQTPFLLSGVVFVTHPWSKGHKVTLWAQQRANSGQGAGPVSWLQVRADFWEPIKTLHMPSNYAGGWKQR